MNKEQRDRILRSVREWNEWRRQNAETIDLTGADLTGADLTGAYLRGADLRGADLTGADLTGADLTGACLTGACIDWDRHDVIAEILLRAAEEDVEKRKVAGLVIVSRDWCWPEFLRLKDDPLMDWALDALAGYVTDKDNAPGELRKRAREIQERQSAESEVPA